VNRLRKIFKRFERGQVVVVVAGLLPVVLGMTGLAVDVATYAGDRRALQNAADSIAISASKELPDADATLAAANEWAVKNDIDPDDMIVTITGGTTAPKVHVRINRSHEFFFIRALGVSERGIGASAAAVKVSMGGGAGIVPWSVTQSTIDNSEWGEEVILKYDADGANLGNFGAIRIDGSGASTYETSAKFGSNTVACAETAAPGCDSTACPGVYPDVCAETAPECDGPECTPETGNMTTPTERAVDYRIEHTTDDCDTFDEVFDEAGEGGMHHLNPDCNPWIDGPGKCTSTTDMCSRRVIIIPVVDTFGEGTSDAATVQRFAMFFLEGYEGRCTGSNCEITGRFVRAELTTGALAGTYDEDASIHFTRLSE